MTTESAASKPNWPEWWRPGKPVTIEILGGGDSDGIYLETNSRDPAVAEQALSMYQLTNGGKVGFSMTGMSAANVIRLLRNEPLADFQRGGQPHFYTVVERIEEESEILLRLQYTAGRNNWLSDEEGLKRGWVNTALHKFSKLKIVGLDNDRMTEFWLSRDLQNRVGTAIDRSLIEECYRNGSLESKCDLVLANLLTDYQIEATHYIDDELIYFRPKNPR